MKSILTAMIAMGLLITTSGGPAAAQKTRYSSSSPSQVALDYPVLVHVTLARVVGADTAGSKLHLDTLIDGHKVEMETSADALLRTGDYRARVVKDDEKKSGWYSRSYELTFSDGTHVVFRVVAESE